MHLEHEFEVAAGVEEAWRVLTDVERMARLVPGAEVSEVEGDEYRGVFRGQVGPIAVHYRGGAEFEQLDDLNHRVVLNAGGRDRGGNGNVRAHIVATMAAGEHGTKIRL